MKAGPHTSESALEHRGVSQAQPSVLRSRAAISSAIVAVLFVVGNAHAKGPGIPTAAHLGLTPAYLQGDWCQTHIQYPSQRSVENIGYRFGPDGTLSAQTTPQSEMKPGLLYRYRGEGKITLGTFPGMLLKVKSVGPDAFVLHVFSDMHFRRGPCK